MPCAALLFSCLSQTLLLVVSCCGVSCSAGTDAAPPQLQDFAGWPDAPVLLRMKPLPYQVCLQGGDPARLPLNGGQKIHFETDLFKGCCVMYVAGLHTSPAGLFAGKRRKTRITVQASIGPLMS